jgi:D-serine deaminase-like pyridoxal phosphate-dependent protein
VKDEVRQIKELSTPALLVDLDALDHNVATAEAMFRGTGKLLRPHVKTHRTAGLVLRQLRPPAIGVTCATIGEAEAMVDVGISDVLLANEFVTAPKIERIAVLATRARVMTAVDAVEPVRALATAAERLGVVVDVLVDIDVGLGRCGVRGPREAKTLAAAVDRAQSLRLAGIMGYEGRLRASTRDRKVRIDRALRAMANAKALLESAGFPVSIVSAGGTSTLRDVLANEVVTEVQAGTYALMEHDLDGLGLPFRYAVSIAATVISRSPGRVIVDVGRKTIGCDYGPPAPIDERGKTVAVSEEHTTLAWRGKPPELGARVFLRPSHVRTTFNLYDFVWLARDGRVAEQLPVSARGRSQ